MFEGESKQSSGSNHSIIMTLIEYILSAYDRSRSRLTEEAV
jgi:hypothetical protein